MSAKKVDKGKLYHKLHQLQKKLFRTSENEGHSEEKIVIRKSMIKKIQEKIYGKNKKV